MSDSDPSDIFDEIKAASDRLDGIANVAPVMTSSTLDRMAGAAVFLKCENFQRMGAFKFRGAFNAISRLSDAEKARGVITFFSGNHAQAVAAAGTMLGFETTIVMPEDAPQIKIENTRRLGGNTVLYDRYTGYRETMARERAAERGGARSSGSPARWTCTVPSIPPRG